MDKKDLLIGAGLFVAGVFVGVKCSIDSIAYKLANGVVYIGDGYEARTVYRDKYAFTITTFKDQVITENNEEEVES